MTDEHLRELIAGVATGKTESARELHDFFKSVCAAKIASHAEGDDAAQIAFERVRERIVGGQVSFPGVAPYIAYALTAFDNTVRALRRAEARRRIREKLNNEREPRKKKTTLTHDVRVKETRRHLEVQIDRVPDPRVRIAIRRRYFDEGPDSTWPKLAEELKMHPEVLRRKCERAIKQFPDGDPELCKFSR